MFLPVLAQKIALYKKLQLWGFATRTCSEATEVLSWLYALGYLLLHTLRFG